MNLGNTTGRQRKLAAPEKPKPGMFNVNAETDWLIGGKLTDERAHFNSSTVIPLQIMKVSKQKRYF